MEDPQPEETVEEQVSAKERSPRSPGGRGLCEYRRPQGESGQELCTKGLHRISQGSRALLQESALDLGPTATLVLDLLRLRSPRFNLAHLRPTGVQGVGSSREARGRLHDQ